MPHIRALSIPYLTHSKTRYFVRLLGGTSVERVNACAWCSARVCRRLVAPLIRRKAIAKQYDPVPIFRPHMTAERADHERGGQQGNVHLPENGPAVKIWAARSTVRTPQR